MYTTTIKEKRDHKFERAHARGSWEGLKKERGRENDIITL